VKITQYQSAKSAEESVKSGGEKANDQAKAMKRVKAINHAGEEMAI